MLILSRFFTLPLAAIICLIALPSPSIAQVVPDEESANARISGNGRYVVFQSLADNLAANDATDTYDIFVFDRLTGITELVSVSSAEVPANGESVNPDISADGRYVVFQSNAPNLVTPDNGVTIDVYLRDRVAGTTIRISVDQTGSDPNAHALNPTVSDDGRFVAFESSATDLDINDADGNTDIFVRDTLLNTTTRISVDSNEVPGSGGSRFPDISGNGQFVAFESSAQFDLLDTNPNTDIYVRNLAAGTTSLVSRNFGNTGFSGNSVNASISQTGQFIAFESASSLIVTNDTNTFSDVFVYDRIGNSMERVSLTSTNTQATNGPSQDPHISANARYVVFESVATNLVPGNTAIPDIYLRDRTLDTTTLISVSTINTENNAESRDATVSDNGRVIAFTSDATNLIASDLNQVADIFISDLDNAPIVRVPATGNIVPGPEIDVQGTSVSIANNDTTPGPADGTSFGQAAVSGGQVIHNFSISNVGTDPLILDGNPVVLIQGANASDFVVLAQPTTTTLSSGATVDFQIRFDPSALGTRTATVVISNNDADEDPFQFAIIGIGVSVVAGADLQVTKSGPAQAPVNTNYGYTIEVTNGGPELATDVLVTDVLPGSLTFISASSTSGTVTHTAGTVNADVGDLPVGASATITLIVRATTTGAVTNIATASSGESDPDTSNNTGSSTVFIISNSAIDLRLTQTGAPTPISVGDTATFKFVVKNVGPAQANGVTLFDNLPEQFDFFTGSSSQGTVTGDADSATAEIGTMNPGASVTVFITVIAVSTGNEPNIGLVAALESDPTPGNNSATATVVVGATSGIDLSGFWPAPISERCRFFRGDVRCTIRGQFTVKNSGTLQVGSSRTDFYLSSDTVLDGGDTFLRSANTPRLRQNQQRTVRFSYNLPLNETASGRYIIAVIDAGSAVSETDEGNNQQVILVP